jgi:hypothetical protein
MFYIYIYIFYYQSSEVRTGLSLVFFFPSFGGPNVSERDPRAIFRTLLLYPVFSLRKRFGRCSELFRTLPELWFSSVKTTRHAPVAISHPIDPGTVHEILEQAGIDSSDSLSAVPCFEPPVAPAGNCRAGATFQTEPEDQPAKSEVRNG